MLNCAMYIYRLSVVMHMEWFLAKPKNNTGFS